MNYHPNDGMNEWLNDMILVINELEMYFEDNAGRDCCGQACDCYDNNRSDLTDAYTRLNAAGFMYVEGDLLEFTAIN